MQIKRRAHSNPSPLFRFEKGAVHLGAAVRKTGWIPILAEGWVQFRKVFPPWNPPTAHGGDPSMEGIYQEEHEMKRLMLIAGAVFILTACGGNNTAPSRLEQAKEKALKKPSSIFFSDKTPNELKQYHVVLLTTEGKIEIEFLPEVAPGHVRNFLKLSQAGFYDHTAWHRVVRNFVIQGGDMGTRNPPLQPADVAGGIRRLAPEFSKLKHAAGTVGMARGKELDSAETSFYICLAPQPALDNQYTIFGKVISGMETVRKISSVAIGKGGKPLERVELEKIELIDLDAK
jgi:peptidyl-prolyl cis-trans isomerase B (cyclophilin B)